MNYLQRKKNKPITQYTICALCFYLTVERINKNQKIRTRYTGVSHRISDGIP